MVVVRVDSVDAVLAEEAEAEAEALWFEGAVLLVCMSWWPGLRERLGSLWMRMTTLLLLRMMTREQTQLLLSKKLLYHQSPALLLIPAVR